MESKIKIDDVWAANRVFFDLITVKDRQYAAYYNKNRMMTVASRDLGSTDWQRTVLPNKLHWDSHNYVTMGVDKEGYIHVSGNMHVNPLAYFRSEKPYDISSFIEVNSMVGTEEDRVTYPRFFYDADNNLLFSYRYGTCGDGNIMVNINDPKSCSWKRLSGDPLFMGVKENEHRAAYHKIAKGKDGYFHFVWIWRWSPLVETSHQICYAKTKDYINWQNIDGEEVTLPFEPDNEKLIVDPTPKNGGMHNGRFDIVFDKEGSPVIPYVKYDEEGNTQFYLSRHTGKEWVSNQISDWDFRWEFFGGGDQMTIGGKFEFAGYSKSGLFVFKWMTQDGMSGEYWINPATLEKVSSEGEYTPLIPEDLNKRLTDNPELSLQTVKGKTLKYDEKADFYLKWEAMAPSHGKHRPEIIPDGPLSDLMLIEIKA